MTRLLPQPERRRTSSINLAFQFASVLLTTVQGLLLVPLYLRHLGLETYGAWLAMSSVLSLLMLLDPGVSSVFEQRIAAALGREDRAGLEEVIGTGFVLNLAVYAVLPLVAMGMGPTLASIVGAPSLAAKELYFSFALAALAEAILAVALTNATIVIGLLAYPTTLGSVYVFSTALGIGSTILLLHHGWGVRSIPGGLLVRSACLLLANAALAFHVCFRKMGLRPRLKKEELRQIAALTGHSWAARTSESLTGQADAFFTSIFMGPALVPVLTVTRNASDIIGQLTSRIAVAMTPAIAHLKAEGNEERLSEIASRIVSLVVWVSAVGFGGYLVFNRDFVSFWVGSAVYGGDPLTGAFALVVFLSGIARAVSRLLFSVGRIPDVSQAALAESGLRLGSLLLLYLAGAKLLAPPIAALLSSTCVGLWYLPRLFSQEFSLKPVGASELVVRIVSSLLTIAAVGVSWRLLFSAPSGWEGFIASTFAFACLAVISLSAVDRRLRSELRSAFQAVAPAFSRAPTA